MACPVPSVLSLFVLIVTDHSCGNFLYLVTFLTYYATRFTRLKGQESGFKLISRISVFKRCTVRERFRIPETVFPDTPLCSTQGDAEEGSQCFMH